MVGICLRTKSRLKNRSRMTNRMTPPIVSQMGGTEAPRILTFSLLEPEVPLPEVFLPFVGGLALPILPMGVPLGLMVLKPGRLKKVVGAWNCVLSACAFCMSV